MNLIAYAISDYLDAQELATLTQTGHFTWGDNEHSLVRVDRVRKACQELGISIEVFHGLRPETLLDLEN